MWNGVTDIINFLKTKHRQIESTMQETLIKSEKCSG